MRGGVHEQRPARANELILRGALLDVELDIIEVSPNRCCLRHGARKGSAATFVVRRCDQEWLRASRLSRSSTHEISTAHDVGNEQTIDKMTAVFVDQCRERYEMQRRVG